MREAAEEASSELNPGAQLPGKDGALAGVSMVLCAQLDSAPPLQGQAWSQQPSEGVLLTSMVPVAF